MAITFNTKGYDPYIDFLKAYSILVVVFCHGFPFLKEVGYPIWGAEIPLFILVQVFHCYKRDAKQINWSSIIRRIVVPFLLVQLFIFFVLFFNWESNNIPKLIKDGLVGGGYGPGAYYPWVYLQMVLIIPLFRPICEHLGKWPSFLVFIVFSIAIEIICSLTNIPDSLYRLLCLRYIMLLWFGWVWAKEGIHLNPFIVIISICSLGAVIFLGYFDVDCEPLLFNTGWATHRWICYFWYGFLLELPLWALYSILTISKLSVCFIKSLANSSYEIFLIQMAYFALLSPNYFSFFNNSYIQFVFWFLMAFVISITGGICLNKFEKLIYDRRLNYLKNDKTD